MLILLVAGSYIFFDKAIPDSKSSERYVTLSLSNVLISAVILMPVLFLMQNGKPLDLPDEEKTANALKTIQEFSNQAARNGGEVLFIAERQLLVFDEVEGIPLVPKYERQMLMEMAMAGNVDYLREFSSRIENQEFALIVIEPLKVNYKGREAHFGEENDAYVRWVSEPILCSYESVKTIKSIPIQLLAPREDVSDCS
jgi:hypothetical protein